MRRKFLAVLATAAASALTLLALPGTAEADHSWGGYHWARTSNPFTVKLGTNVTSQWTSALNVASTDWTQSTVLDAPVVAGTARGRCKAVSGMVQVCNSTYGNNGWLGIASISITGGTHITSGTVKVNDTYFNTPSYNTPAWRALVMCQEVGHTFGLDHQDEDFANANLGTCMDYTNNPSTNQHPNQHDYDQLVSIYGHLDSTATVASATATAPQVGNDAATWGEQVEGSRAAGHSTFVRELGHGQQVVTFVTWA